MKVPPHARCWLEVDAAALAHNAAHVRERAGVPLTAVVKANGYGLGAAEVARAALAGGAASVAVATAEEARVLREAGVVAPVQILGALLPGELDLALAARAAVTIHEPADLLRVREASLRSGRPVDVHLAVDVGMRRHGVAPRDALDTLRAAQRDPALRVIGVMTHLPNAAGSELELSRARVARFAEVVAEAEQAG
ncbi:MAG TPA: alanine racemase, partial [Planctomycetes bacterium]|nr:alanine racemase [Planctomycetota bacterium]